MNLGSRRGVIGINEEKWSGVVKSSGARSCKDPQWFNGDWYPVDGDGDKILKGPQYGWWAKWP